MNNVFHFDANSDFFEDGLQFWIIIFTDGIRFNNKDNKYHSGGVSKTL